MTLNAQKVDTSPIDASMAVGFGQDEQVQGGGEVAASLAEDQSEPGQVRVEKSQQS